MMTGIDNAILAEVPADEVTEKPVLADVIIDERMEFYGAKYQRSDDIPMALANHCYHGVRCRRDYS